ncbi:hypothetical protein [Geobacillus kaustophilus]|uniref:hypothetical protein n=1 Tax=Geobacillus kaustophilus TaxID=1462 RepID=UPI0005CCA7CC|nr:hypothetical protein [Geobacillus kaustophilus]
MALYKDIVQKGNMEKVKPYCYYDDVKKLVLDICELHNDFSKKLARSGNFTPVNLRRKLITDVSLVLDDRGVFILDNSFYSLIKNYIYRLEELVIDIDFEFTYKHLDCRLRVKQNESIVNKLKYYRVGKEDKGLYPLNKCLNDLLGFRIIIDDFDHNCVYFDALCESIKAEYKIRKMNASKNGYKATHIYFYGESNTYFPWELQIWNSSDEDQNEQSHRIHKQEYVKWATIYKNSTEFEGGV